jgi:hypothetical protein
MTFDPSLRSLGARGARTIDRGNHGWLHAAARCSRVQGHETARNGWR